MMSTTIIETMAARPSPSLRVIKNGFGAEITGLDFANGVTDEGYRFIEEAVKKVGAWSRRLEWSGAKTIRSMDLPSSERQN